jgi:hypothetical protein
MDQEKRRRTRVPVHFGVTVLLGRERIEVTIVNISLTGILCSTSPRFREGAACKVVLSLSDEFKITIDSKILRVDDQQTAISFTAMDEESFAHLKRLVQLNAADADLIDREIHKPIFKSK